MERSRPTGSCRRRRTTHRNGVQSAEYGSSFHRDACCRAILNRLLGERGLGFDADDRHWFIHAWHRLPAWPDVRNGLERLRSRFTVCALSNGNVSLLEDLATYNALGFDHILSAEHARVGGNRKLHIRDRRKLRSDVGLVICTDPPWWRSYMDGALQCTSGARGCC